ncbi:MAG: tetratricopeptide repeat protein [Proteobacteria bacterium]|nr:tetratricopeptide repeat protein [Pseudomonadota bacterium]
MKRFVRSIKLVGLGLCLLAAVAWAGAADDFQSGNRAALDGDYPTALDRYTRAIDSGELSGRNLAAAYYGRAEAWLASREPGRADEDFSRATEIDPADAEAWLGRGKARAAGGETRQAIGDFERAIDLAPDDPEAFIRRGDARFALKDDAGAIDDYDRALKLDPGRAVVHYNRGLAWASKGDLHLALADAREALRLDPENLAYQDRVKRLEAMVLKKK